MTSLADATPSDARTWIDRDLWQQLARSLDSDEFYAAWLNLQCPQIPHVRSGLLLAETEADRTFATAAVWPDTGEAGEALLEAARAALEEGEALVVDLQREYGSRYPVLRDSVALCFPLEIEGRVVCVAAVEAGNKDTQDLEAAMRQLQWGVSWLEAFFLRYQNADDEATIDRLVTALYMTATASREHSFKASVTSFVTELATRLDCERVSCGFLSGKTIKVESVSHSGQFGRQMNLVNAIAAAMTEAIEQNTTVNYPEPAGNGRITHHHEALARQQNGGAILTVPLVADGRNIGAVCIEGSVQEAFDGDTVSLCESIASVVGPVFRDKKLNDRWMITKLKDSAFTQLARLFGPRYTGRKIAALALLAICVTLYFARGDFRVTADVVLEGAEQRAVVSPYDGFVAASVKRVGDRVAGGDLIARLDDTDLRLDLVELTSGQAQARSQYDEAMAEHDRAKAKIFKAKIEQAEARIGLVNEKLNRTRLVSPIDGMIVNGDLSQSLGAAVTRGEVLFEIASLYDYRVNLKVDERDIAHVEPGQSVQLVLSAHPDDRVEVVVDSITPVTRAAEGRNFFRVEADLRDDDGYLRPGMEGIAKIHVGEERYVWIWTRKLMNWLRLWTWRWME